MTDFHSDWLQSNRLESAFLVILSVLGRQTSMDIKARRALPLVRMCLGTKEKSNSSGKGLAMSPHLTQVFQWMGTLFFYRRLLFEGRVKLLVFRDLSLVIRGTGTGKWGSTWLEGAAWDWCHACELTTNCWFQPILYATGGFTSTVVQTTASMYSTRVVSACYVIIRSSYCSSLAYIYRESI